MKEAGMSLSGVRRVSFGLALVTAWLSATPAEAQTAPQRFSYSVKFVCGLQRPSQEPGETIVKPGNYATEVNIFNPFQVRSPIRKRVILLVDEGKPIGREPEQQGPRGFDSIVLAPLFATMDDCDRLWTLTHPGAALPAPMPLTIGFLVLESLSELDVDAVYTAATPGFPGALNQGISIDVERVPVRRLPVLQPTATPTQPPRPTIVPTIAPPTDVR
jgi:hypothetical protein